MDLSEQQLNEMIDVALTAREYKNAYGVSLIPYHTHNGTDSPLIDKAANGLIGSSDTSLFESYIDLVHWISLDAFGEITSGSGSVEADDGEINMNTSNLVNSYHGVGSLTPYYNIAETNKPLVVEWVIKNMDNGSGVGGFPMTNAELRCYMSSDISSNAPNDVHNHAGFRLASQQLYGTVADNTTEATVTLGAVDMLLTGRQFSRLRMELVRGVSCNFYVNNILMGSLSTNLPITSDLGHNITITTLTGIQKSVNWGRVLMQKEY